MDEVRLYAVHVKTQILLWLILVWETHHLESWLLGHVEKLILGSISDAGVPLS